MKGWKITGVIATMAIILSVPLYLLKHKYVISDLESIQSQVAPTFVGTRKCMDCHKNEYDKWEDSHHDHAMEIADKNTVLGNFDNAVFENHGITSRFYQKDGKFFVYTQGPNGKMGDFEVTHTFGWFPLQQYLVPFPGGRLQCLPIAWDVREKKWYHLYPKEPLDPKDWLYWTNAGQNWNGMCAECHSTNLKKNYDLQTDAYQTTWSDIDVGCEACHGPGSRHTEWAQMPDMARPQVENYELVVRTSEISSRKLVELCAPCHSRRAVLGDYTHAEPDLLDSLLPSLLNENLYFADGQILEEVYVYGSFTQSKMYHRDVRCSDCHDVHSLKRVKEGNKLCLQCHRANEYNTKEHHFHKKKGEKGKPIKSLQGEILFDIGTGAECVQCHMPGRTYMGIDYRPDHSFRVPRPDLSITIGGPDACKRCHYDKSSQWSDETLTKWFGPGRRRHYGAIIDAGRKNQPNVGKDLIRLALDPLYPVIVRATAISLLTAYPGEESTQAIKLALMDDEALIRRTAVETIAPIHQEEKSELITPLLYDPVKAVRIEAARRLAEDPKKRLDPDQGKVFKSVLEEYISSMKFSADFSFGRYNLGNLYVAMNQPEEAIGNYLAAIKIDSLFYPAKVNLAMFYNQKGENDKAEVLLREVVQEHPEMHEIAYSLGLLLAEMKQFDPAAIYLEKAAKGMPERARVHYNLGLLLQHLQKDEKAEEALLKALEIDPNSMEYLYALADFYLKRNKFQKAKHMAQQMVVKHPNEPIGQELLGIIMRNLPKANQ
ncbi:MAG: tetratricopeptide repeat protein [Deltaproteobacteria bacterium]|jgi:tetratricopeptide (TPR) repeat protein|nr:tetratricopeptide repeat protein [Deltaproteobacteria bacterium]